MKTNSTHLQPGIRRIPICLPLCQNKKIFHSGFLFPILFFLFAGVSVLHAQGNDPCDINDGWWDDKYLTLKSGIEDGDTVHQTSCQVPRSASAQDLVHYRFLKNYCPPVRFVPYPGLRPIPGVTNSSVILSRQPRVRVIRPLYRFGNCIKVTAHCYLDDLPDDAPEGMYQLWRYEYIVEDLVCYRKYKLTYYLALYDHGAPTYQCFPGDTTVASVADLPPVDEKVKIIDFCQYVDWWNVETTAVVDTASGDTTCFVRTWSAGDPVGNESSRSQKIWIGGDDSGDDPDGSSALVSRTSRKSDTWKVYPNPVRESIQINIYTERGLDYQLYDGVGRSVKKGIYHRGQPIRIRGLDPGMYYLQLSDQSEVYGVRKVMVVD